MSLINKKLLKEFIDEVGVIIKCGRGICSPNDDDTQEHVDQAKYRLKKVRELYRKIKDDKVKAISKNLIEHKLITEYIYEAKKPAQLIFNIEGKHYALTVVDINGGELNKLQIHELKSLAAFEEAEKELTFAERAKQTSKWALAGLCTGCGNKPRECACPPDPRPDWNQFTG